MTNFVTFDGGQVKELFLSQKHPITYIPKLESNRHVKIITETKRVGGGYLITQTKKPVPIDKTQVFLLKKLIDIKLNNRNDLLSSIDDIISKNVKIFQNLDNFERCEFQNSVLKFQENLAKIQKLNSENENLDKILETKRLELDILKRDKIEEIGEVESSVKNKDEQLDKLEERIFNLKIYEDVSRPILNIRAQKLKDDIKDLEIENKIENEKLMELNKSRIDRILQDSSNETNDLLNNTVDKCVNAYPDRLKKEINLLKSEIQNLETDIQNLPRNKFNDRTKTKSLNFKTKIDETDEITFDFERRVKLPI